MEYSVKRGFGPGKIKEYFVAEADGDTLQAVIGASYGRPFLCSYSAGIWGT